MTQLRFLKDLSETNEKKKKSYPRRATKDDEGPLRH